MWRLVLALALGAVCGCRNDTTGPTSGPEAGIYALIAVDGRALPTNVSEGGTQIEIVSGTLTLGSGRSVRMSTSYRPSPGAAIVTTEVNGTYAIDGTAMSFSFSNGGSGSGTLSGGDCAFLNEGLVWLYRKS